MYREYKRSSYDITFSPEDAFYIKVKYRHIFKKAYLFDLELDF